VKSSLLGKLRAGAHTDPEHDEIGRQRAAMLELDALRADGARTPQMQGGRRTARVGCARSRQARGSLSRLARRPPMTFLLGNVKRSDDLVEPRIRNRSEFVLNRTSWITTVEEDAISSLRANQGERLLRRAAVVEHECHVSQGAPHARRRAVSWGILIGVYQRHTVAALFFAGFDT
jgi:hypothetical protein